MSENTDATQPLPIPPERALTSLPDKLVKKEMPIDPEIAACFEEIRGYATQIVQTVSDEANRPIAESPLEQPQASKEQLQQIVNTTPWNCYFSKGTKGGFEERPFDAVFAYFPVPGGSWDFSKTGVDKSTLIVTKDPKTGEETIATRFFTYKANPEEKEDIAAWFAQDKTQVSVTRHKDGHYSTTDEPLALAEKILLANLRSARDFFRQVNEYSAQVNFELYSKARSAIRFHFEATKTDTTEIH
jgi:hypothetical protein